MAYFSKIYIITIKNLVLLYELFIINNIS